MTAATTSPPAVAPSHEPLMLDWLLPEFDATIAEHRVIDAEPASVDRAIATVDMAEIPQAYPAVRGVLTARVAAERLVNALHGRPTPALEPDGPMRLGDLPAHGEWVKFSDDPAWEHADPRLLRGPQSGARPGLARALPALLARRPPRRGDRDARVPGGCREGVAAYLAVGRPVMLHWGANCEEVHKRLPGDETVPGPVGGRRRRRPDLSAENYGRELWRASDDARRRMGQDRSMPLSHRTEISVHVVPGRKGVWTVRGEEDGAAASVHASATEAERAAHGYARESGATQVVLHDRLARLYAVPVNRR